MKWAKTNMTIKNATRLLLLIIGFIVATLPFDTFLSTSFIIKSIITGFLAIVVIILLCYQERKNVTNR